MEKTPEAVNDYMVSVKSAYLVPIKSTRKRDTPTDLNADRSENQKNGAAEDSLNFTEKVQRSSESGDDSLPPSMNTTSVSTFATDGEAPEGYKSNGYKIDDRDRQRSHKKDFTGGMSSSSDTTTALMFSRACE